MIFLEIKESLQIFYARFSTAINAVVKFLVSFLFLFFLRGELGFFSVFDNFAVIALISLACSILPYGAISFIMTVVLLAHVYEVSLEIALIAAALLFMIGLIYFGFQPHNAFWFLLTPLAFYLRIPYVIPLIAALSGSLSGMYPACSGVIVYYLVSYVSENAAAIKGDITSDIIEKCVQMIEALVTDKEMIFFVVAFAAGMLVVYFFRSLSVNYAWVIAVGLGLLVQLAVLFTGVMVFEADFSLIGIIAGMAVSILITAAYMFFVFAVDYSRTEKMEFEDDDYVYYVKAVPKLAVRRHHSHQDGSGRQGRQHR